VFSTLYYLDFFDVSSLSYFNKIDSKRLWTTDTYCILINPILWCILGTSTGEVHILWNILGAFRTMNLIPIYSNSPSRKKLCIFLGKLLQIFCFLLWSFMTMDAYLLKYECLNIVHTIWFKVAHTYWVFTNTYQCI